MRHHTPHKLTSCSPLCCLDLLTQKIIISCHAFFKETVFPFVFMTPTQPSFYTFLDDPMHTSPISCHLLGRTYHPTL